MIATDLRQQYDQQGYVIVRNAIDPDLAAETSAHVDWLLQKYPDMRPEQLHHELLVDDPFMHRLVGDDRLLDIVETFIGPNIALFAAHYIAKRPYDGQEVLWHQDGTYWPLEPMEVTTIWLAATDSTVENGCMRVLPGTQHNRLLSRAELQEVDDGKNVLASGIHPSQIDDSDVIDIELKAGDVSIHNPQIIHGSKANTSDQWRKGLTLRYIPTSTWVKRAEHANILLRGRSVPGVANLYAARPRFVPGEHMAFYGCEYW
ncbi:MAG: phytanoyl-CoA dioxygenase family protein [Anaerolineae bacterium]|nr:phytanoyl-CoA dioxygenase family protein [Anaerolineae bacterium]